MQPASSLEHEFSSLVIERCPSGMMIYNPEGRIVLVNAVIERLFGYSREELIGLRADILVPNVLFKNGSGPCPHNPLGIRKDKSEFPVEVSLAPLPADGGEFILGVVADISARREHERLKDEFVSTVSHELRAPLTSIAGSLGLLTGGAVGTIPEPTLRLLKIAHKNSIRLVRLINDILDIEKIESGQILLDLKRVELRGLIEQAIEANRGYAESFDVSVVLNQASATADVRADPDRLLQVVTNLLSNACKFSPTKSEVQVAIEITEDSVRTVVRDHGDGIPVDFRPRIFDKFAQADAGEARKKGGTGLGLSIVKQIMTLLGGSVDFRDAPGGGTEFYIDLPRALSDSRLEPSVSPLSDQLTIQQAARV